MKYYKTQFYKLLKSAIKNDDDLELIIKLINPLIIKNSFNKKQFNEELYSELKLYAIQIIRKKVFLKKISKKF